MNEPRSADGHRTALRISGWVVTSGLLAVLATTTLTWISGVHAAAQRDFDERERLTEQATAAVATATSDAWRLGTGNLRLEASNSAKADRLVQRVFVDSRAAWQIQSSLTRLRLEAFLGQSPSDEAVLRSWQITTDAVDALILLGGRLRLSQDRVDAVRTLRAAVDGVRLETTVSPDAWRTLSQNPAAFPSDAFRSAYKGAVAAVRDLAAEEIAAVQRHHTRFWPHTCDLFFMGC